MPNSDTLKWGDYLSEEDPQLSRELIQVLRTQKNSGPLLRHSFKREDLRISALRAIHDLKDKAALEMAANATRDTNAKIRKTAFAVLVSSEAPLAQLSQKRGFENPNPCINGEVVLKVSTTIPGHAEVISGGGGEGKVS